MSVPFGRGPVGLVAPRALRRAVRVGSHLTERVVAPTVVSLPVEQGRRLGEVRVYEGRRLVARSPLVAARTVEAPGLSARVGWYAERVAEKLTGWLP